MFAFLNLQVLADLVAMAALALHYAAGKTDGQTVISEAIAEFKELTADLPQTGWVGRFLTNEDKITRLLNFVLSLLGGADALKSQLQAITVKALPQDAGPALGISIPIGG